MRDRKRALVATLPKQTSDRRLGPAPASETHWRIERLVKIALRQIPEYIYHGQSLAIPKRRIC